MESSHPQVVLRNNVGGIRVSTPQNSKPDILLTCFFTVVRLNISVRGMESMMAVMFGQCITGPCGLLCDVPQQSLSDYIKHTICSTILQGKTEGQIGQQQPT